MLRGSFVKYCMMQPFRKKHTIFPKNVKHNRNAGCIFFLTIAIKNFFLIVPMLIMTMSLPNFHFLEHYEWVYNNIVDCLLLMLKGGLFTNF